MRTSAAPAVTARAPWWHTASWIGLLLLGAFNLFAVAADLASDSSTGLPADHSGTFTKLAGGTWTSFTTTQPGAARYITLLERGYALHELVFTVLFLAIVTIPLRDRRWWAWWACWSILIAYLGYTLTFGIHDPAILARSLTGVIALPLLLLAQLPAILSSRRAPAASAVAGQG